MSQQRKMQLSDVLDEVVMSDWPDTDEEIDAVLVQDVPRYSDADKRAIVERILGENGHDSLVANEEHTDTLFDHLDSVVPGRKIDALPPTKRSSSTRVLDLTALVVEAYVRVRNSLPVDFVILDPTHSAWFVSECRRRGAEVSEYHLNRALMNARKAGSLASLTPSNPSPVDKSRFDEFSFASEMALRVVQEKWFERSHESVSLDRILCDPRLTVEFDRVAKEIACMDVDVLSLRWAALAHRKTGRSVRIECPLRMSMFDQLGRLRDLRPSRVPKTPGIYLCRVKSGDVYVASTENLRHRLERHLEAGPDLLPPSLTGANRAACSIGVAEVSMSSHKRSALVNAFKYERYPSLNFVGLLPAA